MIPRPIPQQSLQDDLRDAIASGDLARIARARRALRRAGITSSDGSVAVPDGFQDDEGEDTSPETPESDLSDIDTPEGSGEVDSFGSSDKLSMYDSGPLKLDVDLPERKSDTAFRLLELAGRAGTSILDNRAEKKADRKNRQAVARSNLVTALTGKQQTPTLRSPKKGIARTLLSSLGGAGKVGQARVADQNAAAQADFKNEVDLYKNKATAYNAYTNRYNARKKGTGKTGAGEPSETDLRMMGQGLGQLIRDQGTDVTTYESMAQSLLQDPTARRIRDNHPHMFSHLVSGALQGYFKQEKSVLGNDARTRGLDLTDVRGTRTVANQVLQSATNAVKSFAENMSEIDIDAIQRVADEEFDTLPAEEDPWTNALAAKAKRAAIEGAFTAHYDKRAKKNSAALKEKEFKFRKELREIDVNRVTLDTLERNPVLASFKGQNGVAQSFRALQEIHLEQNWNSEGSRGGNDIAFANMWQRLVDPATVREGDIALMGMSASTFDEMVKDVKRLAEGGMLPPELRESMWASAQALYNGRLEFVVDSLYGTLNMLSDATIDMAFNGMSREGIIENLLTHPAVGRQTVGDQPTREVEVDGNGMLRR